MSLIIIAYPWLLFDIKNPAWGCSGKQSSRAVNQAAHIQFQDLKI